MPNEIKPDLDDRVTEQKKTIVELVEDEVGMGCGAWDMADPMSIIDAAIKCSHADVYKALSISKTNRIYELESELAGAERRVRELEEVVDWIKQHHPGVIKANILAARTQHTTIHRDGEEGRKL